MVSKPIAKNTTCRSGLRRAILSASSGEYTMRTSAPSALGVEEDAVAAGHAHHVAEVVRITPGCFAM